MEVIFASSYDEKHPPENIFDNNKKTFFSSTGMFPQEICVQFDPFKIVNNVSLTGCGIKKIVIHTCENDSAVNFVKQAEQANVPNSNGLQSIKLDLKKSPRVKVMKIEVLEGYDEFFTIHTFGVLWKYRKKVDERKNIYCKENILYVIIYFINHI